MLNSLSCATLACRILSEPGSGCSEQWSAEMTLVLAKATAGGSQGFRSCLSWDSNIPPQFLLKWCSWDADEVVPGSRWGLLLCAALYLDFLGAPATCLSVSLEVGPWQNNTEEVFVLLVFFLSWVQGLLCRSEKWN